MYHIYNIKGPSYYALDASAATAASALASLLLLISLPWINICDCELPAGESTNARKPRRQSQELDGLNRLVNLTQFPAFSNFFPPLDFAVYQLIQ